MISFIAVVVVPQQTLKLSLNMYNTIYKYTRKYQFHPFYLRFHQAYSFKSNSDFLYRVELNREPDVKTAAALFQQLCYNNKAQLQAGIIVAGYDPRHGGEVYNIPLGGSLHKQPWAIGGIE